MIVVGHLFFKKFLFGNLQNFVGAVMFKLRFQFIEFLLVLFQGLNFGIWCSLILDKLKQHLSLVFENYILDVDIRFNDASFRFKVPTLIDFCSSQVYL